MKDNPFSDSPPAARCRSTLLSDACFQFLKPLRRQLDHQLDRRWVVTFLATVLAILIPRHRNHGLVLSELGSFLLSPGTAVAGTKPPQRLLYCIPGSAHLIEDFLWQQAHERVAPWQAPHEDTFVVWDERLIEKPESLTWDGLCPVRSTQAPRWKRINPGFFNPPTGRPIFVPGFQGVRLMVLGRQGAPTLAHWRWWTTRGALASRRRLQQAEILSAVVRRWQDQVIPLGDRGFAGRPWLRWVLRWPVRFLLRWPTSFNWMDAQGQARQAWQSTRSKRSGNHPWVFDTRRRGWRKTGMVFVRIFEPRGVHTCTALPLRCAHLHRTACGAVQVSGTDVRSVQCRCPLGLVVSRPGAGRSPWYRLTHEPLHTIEDAWRSVGAYARRWQIEMGLRYQKSDLALESIRLRKWDVRSQLLGRVALAYAYSLSLIEPTFQTSIAGLLEQWCPPHDQRSHRIVAPLHRLRFALAQFWRTHPPPFLARLNSA